MNNLEIEKWGKWKITWLKTSKADDALAAFYRGEINGFGVSPLKGFLGNDISFLKDVAQEHIGLIFPHAADYDFKVLQDFQKLKFLTITNAKKSINLNRLTSLEDLVLEWHSGHNLPFENSALRRIHLRYYKSKNHNLEALAAYPKLEILDLVQANLISLDGIERFLSLINCNFAYLTKLEFVKSLAKTQVQYVKFEACKKIADLESLSKCPNLKKLLLFKHADLESLDFLNFFHALEEFRFVSTKIKDGNMRPLLKLKRVGFINNRSYSHTAEEIKRKIGQPIVPWDQSGENENEATIK